MSKKLFVGNIPFEVNDADLATVLAVAGTVVSAKVIINNKTGRSKGYGFVEMETEEMAAVAVQKFEGASLNERALTVALATPKQEAAAKSDDEGNDKSGEKSPARITIKPLSVDPTPEISPSQPSEIPTTIEPPMPSTDIPEA